MAEQWNIKRKEFLARCAAAAAGLGLGMGSSCAGSGDAAGQSDTDVQQAGTTASEPRVAYRKLGKPGIEVTEIGFGASRTMDPTLMNHAFELGINFFDTGRSYYNGQNEVLVGKVFKDRRQKIVINSKVQHGSLEKMRSDLETSLKALNTDYIDCLLIHGASEPEHIYGEQTMELFETAREQGKIRTFGFSAHSQAFPLLDLVAQKGFHEVVMVPYNFLGAFTHMLNSRNKSSWDAPLLEDRIVSAARQGVSVIAMKTCSGGYMKDSQGGESYPAALKWVLQNPHVKTTATAMGNFQQIGENITAMGAEGALDERDRDALLAYAAAWGREYCRMCGTCRGQCPAGVDVPEVNRLQMYAESYGGDMAAEARACYAAAGGPDASACEDCEQCAVQCPWGVALDSKLRRAHAVLS